MREIAAALLAVMVITSLGIYGYQYATTGRVEGIRFSAVLAAGENTFYKVVIRTVTSTGNAVNYTLTPSDSSCVIPQGSQILEIIPFMNVTTAYCPEYANYPGDYVYFQLSLYYNDTRVYFLYDINPYGTWNGDTQTWDCYGHGWCYYTLNQQGLYTITITAYTR